MRRTPFESWKRRTPSDQDEAEAAELIRKVGDPESLSPQALHRVAHRLRSPTRRRPVFSDIRLAAASVAVLILFVTGALATIRFFDRQPEVAAVSRAPADRMLALKETTPPPAAPPEAAPPQAAPLEPAPSEALRLEEPQLRLDSKSGRRKLFAADLDEGDRSSGSGFAQAAPALATRERAAMGKSISPMAAPGASRTSDAAHPDACTSQIAAYSSAIARNQGDLQRALFSRGSCRLRNGEREAGSADLRTYLARFPDGRFAERAKALLANAPVPAHAP